MQKTEPFELHLPILFYSAQGLTNWWDQYPPSVSTDDCAAVYAAKGVTNTDIWKWVTYGCGYKNSIGHICQTIKETTGTYSFFVIHVLYIHSKSIASYIVDISIYLRFGQFVALKGAFSF